MYLNSKVQFGYNNIINLIKYITKFKNTNQ